MVRHRTIGMGCLALLLGCATTGDTLSGEPAAPATGQTEPKPDDAWAVQTMSKLERRLQEAERVELEFAIQSSGAFVSHLSGTLTWVRDGELTLDATGDFGGEPQDLHLRADASTLTTTVAGESRHSGPRPAALIEAVVLSLTRQGLLHNLALLSAGLQPEHADGHIDAWLRYVEPQLGPPEVFGGDEARPLEFQIEVEGQHVGHATLWLTPDDTPLERRQTVEFPDGTMQVVERYTTFVIE